MLHKLKQLVPSSWRRPYHFVMAYVAAWLYRYPSKGMRVIGVTGTNGKSSTTQLIGQLLMHLGQTVGWTTTDTFRVADKVMVNRKKMTMLGRTQTQRLLQEMRRAACGYAIVETSSQGIDQYRHKGIVYDTAVFTNLTPEHIEAHGGFENYKAAKLKLFRAVETRARKRLQGTPVPRQIVVNANDPYAPEFAAFSVDGLLAFERDDADMHTVPADEVVVARKVRHTQKGTTAVVNGTSVQIPLMGGYYFANALCAITTVHGLGFALPDVLKAAEKLEPVAGRLERFEHKGATIIVDYAYEPYALEALYAAIEPLKAKRILHLTGSAGGGRDVARREVIGRLAAERDDIVVIANEDPYDEDPQQIIDDVAGAALAAGMVEGKNLFRIVDRQEAIEALIGMATPGDVVLITGKGSEPVMAVAGGAYIPWDDREAVKQAIDYEA